MTAVTLGQLVTPATFDDALANELEIAAGLGLPTTSWQPIDPIRTIYTTMGQVVSDYSNTVSLIAQGGYASYAATIPGESGGNVDADGYDTDWMDLVSVEMFNVSRIEAGFGVGQVTVTNATAATPDQIIADKPRRIFQAPAS